VEAVRVTKRAGIRVLLKEAWERYQLPLALTEVHLNCTREEQLRWLTETWTETQAAIREGVTVKAVTAWSLLGAYNWNSLLTRDEGHYEPGVFDNRKQGLRKTAVGKLVQALATNTEFSHPLLEERGWWHHPQRLLYRPAPLIINAPLRNIKTPPVLILGKTGTLGTAFTRICERRRIPYVALSRQDVNLLDPGDLQTVVDIWKPWAVINATGYVRVDDAESDPERCFDVNAKAPATVAGVCRTHGISFMSFSSDLVFDGAKHQPYLETDDTHPLNVYGKSKAEGERLIQEKDPKALIIRTSAFFGPWDQYNFAHLLQQALKNGQPFDVVKGMTVSPTYVPDLVNASLDLLIDEEYGVWHLSNDGDISWVDFAKELASRSGLSKKMLRIRPPEEMQWKARRPVYSVLQSGKGMKLPVFGNALERYFHEKVA
jgi:dTDP-4-dehydrorhamnose reductase